MTRILYGIQGTGNGHLTRSLLVIRALADLGAEVDVIVSGRPADEVPEIPYARDVQHRHGISFVAFNGRVRPLATLAQVSPRRFIRDARSLALQGYERLVSDYEPVIAWAGRHQGREVIGVGHQYAFGRGVPAAIGDPFSYAILRNFAPVSRRVGLHWLHYAPHILPPVIDVDGLRLRANSGAVVVYLPWENQDRTTAILNTQSDTEFLQYCGDKTASQQRNVRRCPISLTRFKADISAAAGVICNSGFELISEALHLGLPVLTTPLKGQLEQRSNALALERARLASVVSELTPARLRAWLRDNSLVIPQQYPDVARAIAAWLVDPDSQTVESLAADLWSEVEKPASFAAS